jgi:cell division protein FtsW (lipid II flippase)
LRVAETTRRHRPGARRAVSLRLPPEVFEWLFTLAAVAFLVWQSTAFREPEFQRSAGERYRDAQELRVNMLDEAARGKRAATSLEPVSLAELDKAYAALQRSLAAPVLSRLARLDEFANRTREARADSDLQGAIDSLAAETRLYRETYGMAQSGSHSIPLECAWRELVARHGASGERRVLLGMGALLDGESSAAAAAAPTGANGDAWLTAKSDPACAALGMPAQVIAAAAAIVAKARASSSNAGKSQAARRLLENAHWYLALWATAGLLLLQFGRRAVRARRFLPIAALLWSGLGWITQVHVEWLSDRAAQTAALMRWGVRFPDFFQSAVAAAALLLVLGIVFSPAPAPAPAAAAEQPLRQTPSSRMGYAGFVLFVGLGWWLLLDLSASGHGANRFHALYQQVYVFAAFASLTMLAPLRLQLAGGVGRWLGWLLLVTRARRAGLRRALPWLAAGGALMLLLGAAGAASRLQTQITSEVFRLWLILGVSWVFFVRGESALALSAGSGGGMRGMLFLWPLLFVLIVPLAGLVLTDDFGPLFVMLYAASIFVGAGFAFVYFDRAGYRRWLGGAAGVLIAGAWVYLLTFALYSLPTPLARVAERLQSVREPFSASNDQMAIITWFQESAPADGYGLGAVPWCGEIAAAGCRGVPRQIQSDYIYTALVGVYGKAAAVALVALLALWLVRVVIHHGRASRGTIAPGAPVATQQAWLSWIAVCWVGLTLAQLAITVAGNIGWLPLTGINFPFASFGAWSLLANTLFLALAINLPRRA